MTAGREAQRWADWRGVVLTGLISGLLFCVFNAQDFFPPGTGFDPTWFQLLVTPAGAHVIGAAFAQVIRRPGAFEPASTEPLP